MHEIFTRRVSLYTDDPALVADGLLYPQDTMAPVLAMMKKGVDAMRERLISLCREINPDVNVDALQDPNITFHIRKKDIIMKITGAMLKTTYRRYSAWYNKALKAAKRKASVAQLQVPNATRICKKVNPKGIVRGVAAKRCR
ncbi:hypothetical protein BD769DRAFT_1667493 [Suillus cothurnatus]|nr:hypothetical protein BD769DRAFT_1667493 [Suillus cothurnatus]